jgi:hypothetical protein
MAMLNEIKVMTSANSVLILKGRSSYAAAVIGRLKTLAPYALIELVLPGGSVMALLLWLYRRRKLGVGFNRRRDYAPPIHCLSVQRGGGGDGGCSAWNSRVFCRVRAGD